MNLDSNDFRFKGNKIVLLHFGSITCLCSGELRVLVGDSTELEKKRLTPLYVCT